MSTLSSELSNGKHKFILNENHNGKDNKAFDTGGKYDKDDTFDLSFKSQSKIDLSNTTNKTATLTNKVTKLLPVPYYRLFRFATYGELLSSILGIILASIASVGIPLSVILYGEFTALLVDRAIRTGTSSECYFLPLFGGGKVLTNTTIEENREAMLDDAKAFGIGSVVVSTIQFFIAALSIDIINYSALRQISRIRQLFLKSVLRQDISWYDTNTDNNFAVRITDDLDKLKEGIGEKVAIFIYLLMTFVISVIISLFYGWKLTLVILSCAPLIILATAFVAKIQSSLTEKELRSYSSAGTVAEEVLTSIRTVIAFSGQQKESERYRNKLRPAEINGQRKGLFSGIGGGTMWFIIYCCYALAFWYGVGLILDDRDKVDKEYTPAVLVIVLFGVLAGAQNLGLSSPHLEAFATARGSAAAIFSVIDRKPSIDSLGTTGLRPKIQGDIEFNRIYFRYPARKDVQVLNGLNLELKQGQTVALVGPSGCGKSTCLQLLQRLYDPLEGSVKIDGIDIREFNTAWLRSFIGVVGQEPVLFATTIGENIRYGKPDATDNEIEKAAKIANCHDFISKLPNQYDTMVGERGSQLSGGQKQRIAIARAIVRNPKILILDEATSALDPHSERIVQNALERASKGRTTLVVSHRLSTITNADMIVYIDNGNVREKGTHDELMEKEGLYYELVNASNSKGGTPQEGIYMKPKRNSSARKLEMKKASIASIGSTEDDHEVSDDEEHIHTDEHKEEEEEIYKMKWSRILQMNAKEWPYILVGCLAALVVGSSFPVFAILFGEVYGALSVTDPEEVLRKSNIFAMFFILLGFCTGFGTFTQTFMFNISGVRLTSRLRTEVFTAMMNQEMAWFDDVKNSVGALCVRLSGDCASVQGATGTRVGSIIQAFSTIVIGISVSFYFSWNLTLVSLIGVPIVLFAVYFESRYMETSQLDEKLAMESTTRIAIESISNIRTVASLCQEPHILDRYVEESMKVQAACRKKIRLRGVVFSLGQAAPLLGYGISLFYGGWLVANDQIEYETVIKVSEALIFGSWMLGQALAYAPNVDSAIISAGRLMKIIDRTPKIQDPSPNLYDESKPSEGNISYKNAEFYYPSRPNIQVLQGLNLDIQKGHTIALVGPSGCGKSTCIQLLLRYYDPITGQVDLDGTPTTEFPIDKLRSQLGLVSQEPVLFDRTIAENIAYGDNSRTIPMEEIISVAKMANIHKFVSSLPSGYDTSLGSKGAQLSGGQKQRIAIARALIRNPKILLLDEATSALDTQSEKAVQEALDLARTGRTCITIAHRLSTVRNSDVICVIDSGVVAEKGTHDELLNLGKLYAKLYTMQQVG